MCPDYSLQQRTAIVSVQLLIGTIVSPCNKTDLLFTAEQEKLLQEEISQQDDAICCYVHVVDAITQEIVGTASVELWVMIEDGVNILRQVCYVWCSCSICIIIVYICIYVSAYSQ